MEMLEKMDMRLMQTFFIIQLNSCPTRKFSNSRGLTQGGPLTPYLFTIVMERLTLLLNYATQMREIVMKSCADIKIVSYFF